MSSKPDPRDDQFNPYLAPEHAGGLDRPVEAEVAPVPCPRCGAEGAQPVPYSKWHGRRAPRAIQEVRCPQCGAEFDGETGILYPPRAGKLAWFIMALILFLLYLSAVVLVG